MPPEKEIHYFDERRHSSLGPIARFRGTGAEAQRWRRQARRQWELLRAGDIPLNTLPWYLGYFGRRTDPSWYRGLFRPAGDLVCGEITPNYSALSLDDVRWVHENIGGTRIIFLIRNPIERVWSHAQMMHRAQNRPAADAVEDLLEKPAWGRLTDYERTIRFWSSTFGEDQFFLGQMEDITFAPRRLVDAVCNFLEVGAPSAYPVAGRAVHQGGHDTIETRVAVRLAHHFLPALVSMTEHLSGWVRWWRFAAEQLIDDPPTSPTLPYPLWESELWDRWTSSPMSDVVTSLRSGSLSEIRSWGSQEQTALGS